MARILVVDDDMDIREMLREILDQLGHVVLVARDGVEGFSLFQKARADLGIFDVDMPRMNGLDLTKKIKEIAPDFPIILITAYSHLYNPTDVLMLGVEAFLRKPMNVKQLVEVIEKVLKGR